MNRCWDTITSSCVLAQDQGPQGDAQAGVADGQAPADARPQGGGGLFSPGFLTVLALMFLVIYFLMIRPESKRQRAREAMLKKIKKGDTVVTTAGIVGKIHRVEDKEVVLQVDKDSNTRIRFLRSAVNEIIDAGKAKSERDSAEKTAESASSKG